MIGRILSFEAFGTGDGPGVRFVSFMQGCRLAAGLDACGAAGGNVPRILCRF